jgi:chromosome segregation ATPase
MATEPATDTELSVTLSSPLSEWLDERAAALGVDRETLLVQLLGAHRAAEEMNADELETLLSETVTDVDGSTARADQAAVEDLDERIETVDNALSEHVEDLRSRVLQLKDAVESRAPAEHGHPELETASERIGELSANLERIESDLDDVASDLETLASEFESTDERLETVEGRLYRLAQIVLELRRQTTGAAGGTADLESLRRTANRNGTTEADCAKCGERVRIGLLTDAACPHCGEAFDDIEYSSSILGRFKTPTLVEAGSHRTESEPETDDE